MASKGKWSTSELRASVASYLDMMRLYRQGAPVSKKQHYRDLASRFGRTEKSYEYRAQNISYVLSLQGREWLPGLVPAKNVGANVVARLKALLSEAERSAQSRSTNSSTRPVTSRLKRRGFALEMKSFIGRDQRSYLVFLTSKGSFHAFVEVEAKQAARECGARVEKNTRAMWRSVWSKRR